MEHVFIIVQFSGVQFNFSFIFIEHVAVCVFNIYSPHDEKVKQIHMMC